MSSEVVEGRAAKPHQMGATLAPAVDNDPLPCPRCESTNTKFCYYNNYNFSQPRHFCKSCRRYWTHGGTLRDIPVGGGSRKTAKRSRTSSTPVMPGSGSGSASGSGSLLDPLSASPVFVSLPCSVPTGPGPVISGGGNASFTSLLGGFGLGLDDVGFGLGRGVWAFPEVGYGNNGGINTGGVSVASGSGDESVNRGDTWQADSGDHGFDSNGDCFPSLPELAISTPGNTLK